MNSMLIVRAFCRLLAVGRLSAIFISLIIKDIRNAPYRRLEIKEVSEQAVLTHPDQLATHILKTTTTGEDLRVTRLTCNSGVNFRNRYEC